MSSDSEGTYQVFIDSSAFFALATPRDRHHGEAIVIQRRLIAEHWQAFTTNLIVGETYTLLLARLGRTIAYRDIEAIRRSRVTRLVVSSVDENRAWEIIRHYQDKAFSFVDATSFAVMERLRITTAFSFDRDFDQYGFATLQAM